MFCLLAYKNDLGFNVDLRYWLVQFHQDLIDPVYIGLPVRNNETAAAVGDSNPAIRA